MYLALLCLLCLTFDSESFVSETSVLGKSGSTIKSSHNLELNQTWGYIKSNLLQGIRVKRSAVRSPE